MSLSIKLSTKNFAEASKITGNDEFYFIIGDDKISCHKFVAAFLSHTVSQILLSDPTVDSFQIDIGNQQNNEGKKRREEKVQAILHRLIIGEDFEIPEEEIQEFISELDKVNKNSQISDLSNSNISSLLLLNQSLKNDEINDVIYRQLFSFLISNSSQKGQTTKNPSKEEIEKKIYTIQKVEKFLNLIEDHKQPENNFIEYANKYLEQNYNEIIDEIASHFDEIDEKYFFEMNEIFLNSILSSPKLQIENEDSLMSILLNRRKYILSNKSNEINYNNFFIEKVEFEYLTENCVKRFLDEVQFDDISIDVWSQIKKRLVLPVQIQAENKQRHRNKRGPSFKYDISEPFNGILKHLTKISNGNIQTNKTVEITCSNKSCGKYEDIVDYQKEGGHLHVQENPSPRWIQIDFKKRNVQIDSYIIKSPHISEDSCNDKYLKSWRIETSLDATNWKTVDERKNVSELNGNYCKCLFNINKLTEPFRYFRIITDQPSWKNDGDGFNIGKLELFGNIIESS